MPLGCVGRVTVTVTLAEILGPFLTLPQAGLQGACHSGAPAALGSGMSIWGWHAGSLAENMHAHWQARAPYPESLSPDRDRA
jgi:hypothetical protein